MLLFKECIFKKQFSKFFTQCHATLSGIHIHRKILENLSNIYFLDLEFNEQWFNEHSHRNGSNRDTLFEN